MKSNRLQVIIKRLKKVISIAIVENQEEDRNVIESYIKKYQMNSFDYDFNITYFQSGILFVDKYKSNFDIVFMDIDMPQMDGLETAKKIREVDSKVLIIFITNLAQMAIKGYSVNAFDFVPKPVSYYEFSTMLTRALNKNSFDRKTDLIIKSGRKTVKIDALSIVYAEVINHSLIFYTQEGEEINTWDSLSNVYKQVKDLGFAKVNNSQIVNLRSVLLIDGFDITLKNSKHLFLSRKEKKEFYSTFVSFTTGD